MSELDRVRNKIRGKKETRGIGAINKCLVVILITIITMIFLKGNSAFKEKFYKYVYEDHISFTHLNNLYQKYFGNPIPSVKENTKAVFDEKISYSNKEKYLDGVELQVTPNYLVPAINSGMVIFIGEKENYGNTVIIEQVDGTEVWYSNISTNLKMYDYVDKGTNIGEANEKLYLVFKRDGEFINYEGFI